MSDDRQTRALEGIKGYLGDLVKVMTAVNENLVEFAKVVKPPTVEEMAGRNYIARLPNEFDTHFKRDTWEEHDTQSGYRCANKDPKHTAAECVSENGDK